MGFKDTGAMWRSKYDMEPDAFAAEMERLWQQVKPLYDSLYTYTRRKLSEKYGKDSRRLKTNPFPRTCSAICGRRRGATSIRCSRPAGGDRGYDLTQILKPRNTDAKQMVRYGEAFFTSLGFEPLPPTFWERSLFTKPADREVVCHASAWDIDFEKDVRLKMCIQINEEDFSVVHHELGHNYYQMAYAAQPFLFRDSANDAFHEAIGDTIALSVTPPYLKQIGLIDKVPDQSADIGFLLNRALDKVAFLPFGYLVDQWRWKVFSGEISGRAITTKRGGICARSIRVSRHLCRAPNRILMQARSITYRLTRRMHVTSSPRFYSFNFIAHFVGKPDSTDRFISVRSMETRRPARN